MVFSAIEKDFQWFAVTAKYSGQKTFPLRSRPSMTPDNQAGAGKSRRGPGRRPSRSGWRPLLFRVSRYFKDSTGGAAGKGFAEEIFKTVSPVVSPEWGAMGPCLIFAGAGAADVFERQVSGACVAKMACIQAQEAGFLDLRLLDGSRVGGVRGGLWKALAEKGVKLGQKWGFVVIWPATRAEGQDHGPGVLLAGSWWWI